MADPAVDADRRVFLCTVDAIQHRQGAETDRASSTSCVACSCVGGDDIGNHPEVMAENAKIVITVRSTPTDEQTFAKIQSMIDAALESLKDNMKYQIEQENRSGQEEPTGPNQQDLDDMLDNLTIFDQ